MAFSDDEGEVVPLLVTNYYFEDRHAGSVSFAVLPVLFSGDKKPDDGGHPEGEVFLHGTCDGGLRKVYKQVSAWRLWLQGEQPRISVLTKRGKWIKLLKPRKAYEEVTARTILVTASMLHFLKKNPESSARSLWDHLSEIFSFEDLPSYDDIRDHHVLVRKFVERDEELARCQLLLMFLKDGATKRISIKVVQNESDAKKVFIANDHEVDEGLGNVDVDDSEEDSYMVDYVCAFCDNGGEILCCEGRCLRSFHATRSAGVDTYCNSLGYSEAEVEAIQNFLCKNCQHKRHQCFACGKLGSSDKSASAEVFPCVNATCGHFYHPKCVARLLYRDNEAEATECQKNFAAGESFMCPVHKCVACNKGENKEVKELQFAMCRRCPKSYHRRCLPREIAFHDTKEGDNMERAWDDLLPNRILIYCLDHDIDAYLRTPIRNHIRFPEIPEKKKITDMQRMKVKLLAKKKSQDYDSLTLKERSPDFENLYVKKKTWEFDKLSRDKTFVEPKGVVEKRFSNAVGGLSLIKSDRTIAEQVPESKKKVELLKGNARPDSRKAHGTVPADSKTSSKEKAKSLIRTARPTSTTKKSSFPVIDAETIKKIMALMEKTSSSLTLEVIMRKHTMPSTHANTGGHIGKIVTHGLVEGSVEAIRTALKKVEDGGNVEDAKAVCEPKVLKELARWSSKLNVYLSPFLHGARYTSFGRHFTKVDKLVEVVNMLQWYVQNGDMIVDFCCGANDFSQLMKEALDAAGKKCSFKNYDIIQSKNDFCFEKRDWMTVQPDELPTGTQLIMGLNPPFGVKAKLANKFINKALTFNPKLVILIVPPWTERLDRKRPPYDLIWEDFQKLSGESFYLAGSVDIYDKQIGQSNKTPPVLYLWSRRDWAATHKAIASKQGHSAKELDRSLYEEIPSQTRVFASPSEYINEVCETGIAVACGEEEAMRESKNTEPQSNNRSPEDHWEGSLKRRKLNRREKEADGREEIGSSDSDMSISPPNDSDIHSIDYSKQISEEQFPSYNTHDRKQLMNDEGLGGTSSTYGTPGMRRDATPDSTGFAPPGFHQAFPHQGSSGF